MDTFQEKIHYHFRDTKLLAQALTHPSVTYESQEARGNNERLEFLGDAVLQLILTQFLYEKYPHKNEGFLTQVRAGIVSGKSLAEFARQTELGTYLKLGKGEESSGGRNRESNLANAFEALVGAIYLDNGLDAAKKFIIKICQELLDKEIDSLTIDNPKGKLQEILQTLAPSSPQYEIISEKGPSHKKTFTAKVLWKEKKLGMGQGKSKKEAEIAAAQNALEQELWGDT